jgi:hypothetical protein
MLDNQNQHCLFFPAPTIDICSNHRRKGRMPVKLETKKIGNRVYLEGNTYALREKLKNLGFHWDAEERKWWIGSSKQSVVEKLIAEMDGKEIVEDIGKCRVQGKVRYKGNIWYIIGSTVSQDYYAYKVHGPMHMGGYRLRLASLDGKKHFWVDGAECELLKAYRTPERKPPMTLDDLRRFIEDVKNETPEEREERKLRQWAYENFGGICRCANPRDDDEGGCLICGYGIIE